MQKQSKTDIICQMAYEEFVRVGLTNFSLNQFIEQSGISKGQFYYYFKTKEELIYEVVKRKSEEFFKDIEPIVKEQGGFVQKLCVVFQGYVGDSKYDEFDRVLEDSFLHVNIKNSYIVQMSREFYEMKYGFIEEIFDELIASKYLKDNSKEWIQSIIATAHGMYYHSMIKDDFDLSKNFLSYLEMMDGLLRG